MKKYIYISLCIILGSCNEISNKQQNPVVTIYGNHSGNDEIQIVTVDGCEYLYGEWGNATVLTHKGNCKNHGK